MNFFTYGTLMIPTVMFAVTARQFRFEKAMIEGYDRFTVKGELYPGIIPQTDAITKGIIYFNVDKMSWERLDVFESELYQRTKVQVQTQKKEILKAQTYVIKPRYRHYLSSKTWNVREFIQKDLETFLNTYSGFETNG
jgi:gamma-glutamylcyclotransferase (GGCT)/AIG2-like uncharacterized protein YtfP